MGSDNFRIAATVQPSGGGPASSTNIWLDGSAGQASPPIQPPAVLSSSLYRLYPGFWYDAGDFEGSGPEDSDGDGIPDDIEEHCCTLIDDPDTDKDGLLDGVEDKDADCFRDPDETNPCNWDSDGDGLADGEEDVNRNGYRDPGELDPLDEDSDDDGVKDGLERKIGTAPLDQGSWPYIVCVGDQDDTCDDFAQDVSGALEMTSQEASVNYLRVRNVSVEEPGVEIADNIMIGIESGLVTLQP
jgi:hypothetical protein